MLRSVGELIVTTNVLTCSPLVLLTKGIRKSIDDNPQDFFFSHNGITAIYNEMNIANKLLEMKGLNVINGCQSLNTILGCSETATRLDNAFVMCRFYEIPDRVRADKISINTNSQSAVKPRDLRSNDKNVLQLKRVFEQQYSTGWQRRYRRRSARNEWHLDRPGSRAETLQVRKLI